MLINQTLQKLVFTSAALAAAVSLVQAGTRPEVLVSHGRLGHFVVRHEIHPPEADDGVIYKYDDGSSENAVGFGVSGVNSVAAAWFNQFTTVAGGEEIASVDIAWGTPNNSTPASELNGQPVIICIWSDPNNDGNPTDAVLLATVNGTVQNANTDTFVTYTFNSPVNIGPAGTNFFVGDVTPDESNGTYYFQALDQDTSAGKSWLAGMSTGGDVDYMHLGNNDLLGTVDSFGLPGNFLIRANGTSGGGGGLTFNGAAERSTHGSAGKFEISLPGIDPFKGVPTIAFKFNNPIASVGSVTSSCGTVTSMRVDPADSTQFLVQINAKKCNAQEVTVTLNNVSDSSGNNLSSASTMVGLLVGDVNGDGTVDKTDTHIISMDVQMPVTATNFMADISSNGVINAQDARITRENIGMSIGQ